MNHPTNKTAIDALTDEQIAAILHSTGVDTKPSLYFADSLQIDAMSVGTLRLILAKAIAALAPTVQEAEQGSVEERAAFEAWARPNWSLDRGTTGQDYASYRTEGGWIAWRAALAQRAAVAEVASLTKDEIEDTIKSINAAMNPAAGFFFPRGWNVILNKLCAMAGATPTASTPPAPAEKGETGDEPRIELVAQLLEYAGNPGYSHNDYADAMKQAASCIEQLSYCVELYQSKYAAASSQVIDLSHSHAPASSEPAPQGVPEGWKLVPKKPTAEMLDALFVLPDFVGRVIVKHSVDKLPDAYRAMLAAAPAPAATSGELERAKRALIRAGFEDCGGQEWKPPIGPAPRFIEVAATSGGEAVAVIGSGFQLLYCREDWSKGLKVGDALYLAPPSLPATDAASVRAAIHQWRDPRHGGWHDASEEVAYERVDDYYEARTVYLSVTARNDSIRDAALEEAAEACENLVENIGDAAAYDDRDMCEWETERMETAAKCASAIRALISKDAV